MHVYVRLQWRCARFHQVEGYMENVSSFLPLFEISNKGNDRKILRNLGGKFRREVKIEGSRAEAKYIQFCNDKIIIIEDGVFLRRTAKQGGGERIGANHQRCRLVDANQNETVCINPEIQSFETLTKAKINTRIDYRYVFREPEAVWGQIAIEHPSRC